VKQLDCVACGDSVSLFNDYRIAKGRYEHKGEQIVLCPECGSFEYVDDWRSECTCTNCGNEYDPSSGTSASGGSKYACPSCGQIYPVTDAIGEQDGFDLKLYGLEYFCEECDSQENLGKGDYKSYKPTVEADHRLFQQAKREWRESPELNEYIPHEELTPGHMISDRNPVFDHGYSTWKDMFSERQLLSLSKLLQAIDQVEDQNVKEFLLLCFSDSLRGSNMMVTYQIGSNAIDHIFKSNSFDPPKRPAENNPWGAKEGSRDFKRAYDRLKKGVEYGSAPFDRYPGADGEMVKSEPFGQPVGENTTVYQDDSKTLDHENEFDAVITDPPYYDNTIYSELADFFYMWQKILLKDEYEEFGPDATPRSDSIVANPFEGKGEEEFESELREAFDGILSALKQDGILVFTYHHSGVESWGQVLESLCDVGFEVTAAYPITADLDKLEKGEAVSFDIIIIARPATEREPISWNSLRRNIYRTAQTTRKRLEENRDLSQGDIGVVEMGRCFHEYSKHHGEVRRAGETMTAKEVVDEIYGVIQHGSDIGEIDVFLDLLETPDPSYDDLNKLTRGTNATPERMQDMRLYQMDDGFRLGTWDDEARIAYIQDRVANGEELTDLDRTQLLRYRWEHGKSITEYLEQWEITDDLRELCEGLADATGDDTYRNVLESRLGDF
jgi:putative DNA methylase